MISTMEEAVKAARLGDRSGQSYLYEMTYKNAFYVALKYTNNEDDAYDVIHDAYVKAYSRISQLDDDSKFDKWFNSIVASTALDSLKKKKPQLFSDVTADERLDVSERFEADSSVQPEVVMDQNETARLIQEIINGLSDEQRACVTMYYMQEMSVQEISEILDVPEGTVKSRLKYARKNIESKVKELEKKGTKLYPLATFPFFFFLLDKESSESNKSDNTVDRDGIFSKAATTCKSRSGMKPLTGIAVITALAIIIIGGIVGVSAHDSSVNTDVTHIVSPHSFFEKL